MSSLGSSDVDGFKEMLKRLGISASNTLMRPTRCGEPPITRDISEWMDETCLSEGLKYCVWKEIPEKEMEGHLIKFVNMWFTGANGISQEISSTIRNVLLMMPLGISKDLLLRNVLDCAIETAETPKVVDGEKHTIEEPLVDHLNWEEKANVMAFHKWLKHHFHLLTEAEKKTLPGQPCSAEYSLISQKLRVVLGFCALLLMRLLIKNELQMKRYFPYPATKTFDCLFHDIGLNVQITAPTPKFLESAASELSKNSCGREKIILLHVLILQYLKSTTQDDQSSRITREILEKGCLNALECNGMGLVTMFRDVTMLYPNIKERELLSIIAEHKGDSQSKKLLTQFLDIYAQPEKPQYAWKWARILNQNHFANVTIKENKFFCSKLAALLVDKNPGIFGHYDLKNQNRWVDFSMKWAESTKKVLKKMNGVHKHQLEAHEIC